MKNFLENLHKKLKESLPIKKVSEESNKEYEERKHETQQEILIDIRIGTIIKIILIIGLFLFLTEIFFLLKSILIITLISIFLALGISPIVASLEKRKIPRPLAILIIYIIFLGSLGVLFMSVIPLITEQLQKAAIFLGGENNTIIQQLKTFDRFGISQAITGSKNISEISFAEISFAEMITKAEQFFGSTVSILSNVFQGIFNFIYALVLLFFILLEQERLSNSFLSFLPEKKQNFLKKKVTRIQEKMKAWFQGQIILMFSVGIFVFIGLKILEYTLGMQYAGTIAIVAGVMELFPYIGVTITGILAFLVAVNISWPLVIAVLGWLALTQFLEGNLLVPVVMEKVTGLSSVVVILALSIGGILGNAMGGIPLAILGMILAIPVAASISIFLEEFKDRHTKDSEQI